MSVEKAAVTILQRGVMLDNEKRYTESLVCYQEGLQLLVDMMKSEIDVNKKTYLRTKIEGYMKRAEQVKRHISEQKEAGLFHEQLNIENNSIGHSYKSLFGRFFDEDVVNVSVDDPYIRSFHQCQNFLRLCELLVTNCPNLRQVNLVTSYETDKPKNHANGEQTQWFKLLADSLSKRNIKLIVEFSTTLHDRQITLSTGWIIKIGRGLDIYKPPENKFTLGMYDFDLRPCHETQLDIFHSKDVKKI